MTKIYFFITLSLFLSGCTINFNQYKEQTIPDNGILGVYQEIQTNLTSEDIDDMDLSIPISKEINRLEKKGTKLGHGENIMSSSRMPMYYLQQKFECKNENRENCSITAVQAYKNNLPPEFIVGQCDEGDWCLILEPEFQKEFVNNISQLGDFYGFGKDIYTIGSIKGDDTYSIFKNGEEIFSHKMYFGADSVVEDASIVLNSPAFTFYDLKEWIDENTPVFNRNIWFNGDTLNEKYDVDASSFLFSFKDKTGFVAEKDGKKFIFFNGQKISQDFDEIRTHGCCSVFSFPIEIDKNGILFFLAKREEKYLFVEINFNEYLK